MKKILLLVGVVSLATVAAWGQSAPIKRLDGSTISQEQVDKTVSEAMSGAQVPGVALAILNQGRAVYLKGYGLRDKEKNLPMTANTVMSAASLSKVAFAYLVLELVDEGLLDLDKPVYQYLAKPLPEYPNYADLADDARYQRITARMLLTHTSGFANWRSMEADHRLKIHFDPGSRFAYSGEGIDLLQLVVETITKQPLEDLMQKNVFQPLGMTRTSMVWHAEFENDYANGYDENGKSLGPQKRQKADAAGSMQTTVSDFAKFMRAVAAGQRLKKETRAEMLRAQIQIKSKHEFPTLEEETTEQNQSIRLSYGLGWGLYWTSFGEAFFKEGHDDGWRNYAVGFDRGWSGLVIMTNSSNGEGIYQQLLEGVLANSLTPLEWEGFRRGPAKEHKQVSLSVAVLNRYAGRYGEAPNLIMTIRREGDHLAGQSGNGPAVELFAESEKQFFTKSGDAVLTFEVDGRGRATGMVLHADGKDMPIRRID